MKKSIMILVGVTAVTLAALTAEAQDAGSAAQPVSAQMAGAYPVHGLPPHFGWHSFPHGHLWETYCFDKFGGHGGSSGGHCGHALRGHGLHACGSANHHGRHNGCAAGGCGCGAGHGCLHEPCGLGYNDCPLKIFGHLCGSHRSCHACQDGGCGVHGPDAHHHHNQEHAHDHHHGNASDQTDEAPATSSAIPPANHDSPIQLAPVIVDDPVESEPPSPPQAVGPFQTDPAPQPPTSTLPRNVIPEQHRVPAIPTSRINRARTSHELQLCDFIKVE